MRDSLAPDAVVPLLRGSFGKPYRYTKRCPSTQQLLATDDPEGAVAVAEEQTEGRGRLGRRWLAPPGSSILCSVLLRPSLEAARIPELTPLAAEACAEAIAAVTTLAPALKEPNDVLVGGRKAAGILGEARGDYVVLGIGINANVEQGELPREARLPATSLLVQTGERVDRAALLVELLDRFERRYEEWLRR